MSVSLPTLLAPAVTASTETAQTSASFTHTSGGLIIVHCSVTASTAGVPTLTISDTLGGLSWTRIVGSSGTTAITTCALFYATSTGSTGTVTVTPSITTGTSPGISLDVYGVIGQSGVAATATAATTTLTLSGAPAATSLVFAATTVRLGSDPATTLPLGFTGLVTDRHVGSNGYDTIAFQNLSASTTFTFGGSASNSAAAAIEITAAPVLPPTVTVQLDVSGSSFGTAFAATDVSSSAIAGYQYEPVTVTWGRQDQYTQVQPTSVSSVFRNSAGDLTPGKTSGAYYPHIRRSLHRRVIVTANSTAIHVSDDFATTITVLPTTDLWTTQIDGQDLLARYSGTQSSTDLGQSVPGTTLRSFLAEEILLDSPNALYMLQEDEGSTTFADVTSQNQPATVGNSKYGPGTVTAGQSGDGAYVAGSVVDIANPVYSGGTTSAGLFISCPLFSFNVEMWVQMPTSAPAHEVTLLSQYAVDGSGLLLNLEANGTLHLLVFGTGAVLAIATAPLDGLVHQIYITSSTATSSAKIYIDGALAGSATASAFTTGTPTVSSFGGAALTYLGTGSFTQPFSGGFAFLAFYSSPLSAARITAHYNAGANAFIGESTDARMSRLLSYRVNYGSVVDTGLGTMGTQDIAGRSLADCLLEVGQTEGGVVFIDGLGRVNFRSRSRMFSPPVVYSLNFAVGDVMFGGNFRDDTQNVLNDVTITGSSGADQRFSNAASIAQDGEFSTSLSLPIQADSQALDMAGWLVANGVQENIAIESLTINLLTCPAATAAAVLALQPLDRVLVTNMSLYPSAPAASMDFLVQGGVLSLAPDAMTATLNVTPTPVAVAQWDVANWDTGIWGF